MEKGGPFPLHKSTIISKSQVFPQRDCKHGGNPLFIHCFQRKSKAIFQDISPIQNSVHFGSIILEFFMGDYFATLIRDSEKETSHKNGWLFILQKGPITQLFFSRSLRDCAFFCKVNNQRFLWRVSFSLSLILSQILAFFKKEFEFRKQFHCAENRVEFFSLW